MNFDERQACVQQQELECALALARRDGISIMGLAVLHATCVWPVKGRASRFMLL